MNELNPEQVRFFRNSGYIKLPDILSEKEVSELRDYLDTELDKQSTNKLYRLYERNPQLIHRLITHPKLLEPLRSILGPNILFVKNRHNHMTRNDANSTQKDTRLHRDILQPTRGLLTALVYLEESTIDNGCTHIIPGSLYFPYVGVPQPDGGGTWMDEHDEYNGLLDQALPVPMPAGGVLLFDGLVFHKVGLNKTKGQRRSLTLGFRSVDELDFKPDYTRQILVCGKIIYRGNDGAVH